MSFFLAFSTYIGYAAFPIYNNDNNTATESEECDNIILINGEEIPSKIIEITPESNGAAICPQIKEWLNS